MIYTKNSGVLGYTCMDTRKIPKFIIFPCVKFSWMQNLVGLNADYPGTKKESIEGHLFHYSRKERSNSKLQFSFNISTTLLQLLILGCIWKPYRLKPVVSPHIQKCANYKSLQQQFSSFRQILLWFFSPQTAQRLWMSYLKYRYIHIFPKISLISLVNM